MRNPTTKWSRPAPFFYALTTDIWRLASSLSVGLEVRRARNLAPLGGFGPDELRELVGAVADGVRAQVDEQLRDLRVSHGPGDLALEAVHDVSRRSRRHENAVP